MSYKVLEVSKYDSFSDYLSASSDIDGVVIRCGYRGYSNGSIITDSSFSRHYSSFRNNTKIGIYFTSQAISEEEAIEEARYIKNLLGNNTLDLPIYIDISDSTSDKSGRADKIDTVARINIILAFCREIESYGYRAGIRAEDSWFIGTVPTLQISKIQDYSLWDITYASQPISLASKYDAWRYTVDDEIRGLNNKGKVSHFYKNIAGWVDEPIDISSMEMALSKTIYTYDGGKKEPLVSIYGLTQDTDYTVEYTDNVKAGTATVTAHGIGAYTGSISQNFTINPASIANRVITVQYNSYSYTSEPIIPNIITGGLVKDADYSVSFSDNIDVGVATATVTGINNYSGTRLLTFSITPKNVNTCVITIPKKSYSYTGLPIEPTPSLDSGKFKPDMGYTCTYSNNIELGQAKLTIKGFGNMSGTAIVYYDIVNKDISELTVSLAIDSYVYTGTAHEPAVYIPNLHQDVDYTVVYTNNINAGTGRAIVTGIGNYAGEVVKTFIIKPIDIATQNIKLESTTYKYTGGQIKPTIVSSLVEGVDYTTSYTSNLNVGKGAVIVKGIGNYTQNERLTFSIIPRPIDECEVVYNNNTITKKGYYVHGPMVLKCQGNKMIRYIDYDYTLSVEEYENYDEETYVITGMGSFTGTITKVFNTVEEGDPDVPTPPDPPEPPGPGPDPEPPIEPVDPDIPEPQTDTDPGYRYDLHDTPIYMYYSSDNVENVRSGTYYVYDSTILNNRIRLVKTYKNIGRAACWNFWCDIDVLRNLTRLNIGDAVQIVNGKLHQYSNGTGWYKNYAKENNQYYIVSIDTGAKYPYGLANSPTDVLIGYASSKCLTQVAITYVDQSNTASSGGSGGTDPATQQAISDLQSQVGTITNDITNTNARVSELNTTVDNVNTSMRNTEALVDNLNSTVQNIDTKAESNETKINNLNADKETPGSVAYTVDNSETKHDAVQDARITELENEVIPVAWGEF